MNTDIDSGTGTNAEIIACNMGAFSAEERRRYDALRGELQTATEGIRELVDGFAIRLRADPGVLGAAGEWIALERRCCPFFSFALDVRRGTVSAELSITGPDPAKEILRDGLQLAPVVPAERLLSRR